MFGIGTWELIVILVIVLILFGPKKLPELARTLGRAIHDLRHSANTLKQEVESDTSEKNNQSE